MTHIYRSVPRYSIVTLLSLFLCSGSIAGKSRELHSLRPTPVIQALAALHPIDSHTHIFQTSPLLQSMLEHWNLNVIDILVVDDKGPKPRSLETQRTAALAFVHASKGHASLCTTFDPFLFSQPGFLKLTIDGLNRDFTDGAVAVKVWKNVGMELKDGNGKYVMVDDPRLAPIFRDVADHHKTLIAHQAEPDVAWGPPDPKALDSSYYEEHPEWNMAKTPDAPDKKSVLASRDRLVANNPDLRVVGAHLGSMEANVDFVAERFDRYPNFAIDTAARVPHLTLQPTNKVRAFLIKYQDRVLYGTDTDVLAASDVKSDVAHWERQLALDWRYFSSNDTFNYNGREVHGLHLPMPVLQKLYHDNAVRWVPGITF